MTGLFENTDFYTGPPLRDEMVCGAEKDLGVRLPAGYLDLCAYGTGEPCGAVGSRPSSRPPGPATTSRSTCCSE